MQPTLEQVTRLLERTPRALNALLRGLPEDWTHRNEGGSTWTVFDVIGHLVHGERTDWIPRIQRILQDGEGKAFDPFDRLAQERESAGKSLPELLDEFAAARAESLAQLKVLKIQPADFDRRGKHPSLGTVTLGNLLSTWATHDLTHLHQISRIMGYQMREEVGPWTKFLGVLHCTGHGG